jgi:hypothetical protein
VTYAKAALEQVQAGKEVPLDLLGLTIRPRVRITVKPKETDSDH